MVCFDEAILALEIIWYNLKYKTLEFHFKNYCITSTTDTLRLVFIGQLVLGILEGQLPTLLSIGDGSLERGTLPGGHRSL